MKNILTVLLIVLPGLLVAQQENNFLQNTKKEIGKTAINTSNSDFGPAFVNNELLYSSFSEKEIEQLSKGKTKGVFYDLYATPINANGSLRDGKKQLIKDISKGFHSGPVSYCEKTGELFVTLSNFDNPDTRNKVYKKSNIRLRIVVLKMKDGAWEIVDEMPFNNEKYSVGHPAISQSGDTIYYSSNNPETSFGRTDLYMSIRNHGEWGEAINLGENINSENTEMFPFLFEDNTLIFSSDNKGDMGLDLYYSKMNKNGFEKPVALNELNSNADDFGLIIHKNGRLGYFASNREQGQGNDDIYSVTFEGVYKLELLVVDKLSGEEITAPKVKFDDGIGTNINGNMLTRSLNANKRIVASTEIDGYMNNSKTITTENKPFGVIRDTLFVEKVVVGQIFALENIFYDYDKWDILPESKHELNRLVEIMNENPSWKVELGSHTDSRGNDDYNQKLSQKRSNAAVDYIVLAGIDKNRIVAKGYGESHLVNKCANGVQCSDAEHRINRRTEFKIIEL